MLFIQDRNLKLLLQGLIFEGARKGLKVYEFKGLKGVVERDLHLQKTMQLLPSGVAEAGARVWFFVLLVPFLN
jgi:hypothetical protein